VLHWQGIWRAAPAIGITFSLASPVPALAEGTTGLIPSETITGTLVDAGVECPQFRIDPVTDADPDSAAPEGAEAEVISLTGAAPRELGDYQITGRWSRFTYCMQGRSFDVLTFQPLTR
jgi:hypothetical protein